MIETVAAIPTLVGEVTHESAAAWLDRVVVATGGKYHPDTPADGYEPPLAPGDAVNLQAGLDRLFDELDGDPYDLSLSAMRRNYPDEFEGLE